MSRVLYRAMSMVLMGGVTLLAGCRVDVQKGSTGEEKRVQVDTPFGGVHVNTDQTTASDLGLPVYPGAVLDKAEKSTDVHVGFGEWQFRAKVTSIYRSGDSSDKVVNFYKKALGRYGDVLTCVNDEPVGKPDVTHEGLTCEDKDTGTSHSKGLHFGLKDDTWETALKAGSKRHQYIAAVSKDKHEDGQTKFVLISLDLPAGMTKESGSSD